MAIIIRAGKYWHIQWYDTIQRKTKRKSTKLLCTEPNKAKAMKLSKQLQNELSSKNSERKGFRLRPTSVSDAFDHLYRNYTGRSPKTIKDIKRFQKKFLEHFNEDDPVTNITKLSAEQFLLDIAKLKMKQNSIHGYGKRLRHFLNFLFEYEYIPFFKINRMVMTKPEVVEKIVFTHEDYKNIFMKLSTKNSGFRTAVFLLGYTGIRSSDILEIKCDDIDLERRVIKFYSPKGKKFREIGFHKDLIPVLEERIATIGSGNIIPYRNVENLGRAVTTYFKQIGVNGNEYVTRTFRKSFVTLCRNTFKMDKSIVEELVGHKHGNISDRHYNEIGTYVMNEELEKFKMPLLEWMTRGKTDLLNDGNNSKEVEMTH